MRNSKRSKYKLKDRHLFGKREPFPHFDIQPCGVLFHTINNPMKLLLSLLKNVRVFVAFSMEWIDFKACGMVLLRFR
jgi:hypothetical protein